MSKTTSDLLPLARARSCVIIAGGPSLTLSDVDLVGRFAKFDYVYVIGINDAYRISANLSMLYAADAPWWRHHISEIGRYLSKQRSEGFHAADLWTCGDEAKKEFEILNFIESDGSAEFFIKSDHRIGRGCHGGFQALNIALNMGFRKIILLGYDCKAVDSGNRHWFGNHPQSIAKQSPYETWTEVFEKAYPSLCQWDDVDIVNCSRDTAIQCFRRGRLYDELMDAAKLGDPIFNYTE